MVQKTSWFVTFQPFIFVWYNSKRNFIWSITIKSRIVLIAIWLGYIWKVSVTNFLTKKCNYLSCFKKFPLKVKLLWVRFGLKLGYFLSYIWSHTESINPSPPLSNSFRYCPERIIRIHLLALQLKSIVLSIEMMHSSQLKLLKLTFERNPRGSWFDSMQHRNDEDRYTHSWGELMPKQPE